MNIGMILEAPFPPDTRVENECQALVNAGHTIHIFALRFDDRPGNEKLAHQIFVYRLKLPRWFFNKIRVTLLRLPIYNLLWLKFLRKTTVKLRLDAVHVHDIPLSKVGGKLATELKIPLVLDLHENYPAALKIWNYSQKRFGSFFLDNQRWVRYELQYVTKADRVIVVVEEAMERFLQAGIDKKKIVVVSNTLNLEHFRLNGHGQEARMKQALFVISYVGGFGPHRGIEVAIRAMPKILSSVPCAKMVLIGDDSDRRHLENLVSNLCLKDKVEFLGWVPLKDIPGILSEGDIGIIPYLLSEHTQTTIPHKLFQYMFMKKPVVVSDCKPLKRVVTNTKAGLVFKSGDIDDFAGAVLQLQDEKLRKSLGECGYQAVVSRYNWSFDGQKLVELYDELES